MGVTRLLNRVAKCWQPSWFEFAGALLPLNMQDNTDSGAAKSCAEEQSGTRNSSAALHSLMIPNLTTTDIRPYDFRSTPSPLRPMPLQVPFSETVAHAHPPPGRSTASVVESDNGLQSPAVEFAGSLRPRRQARDKALAKIKQASDHPKKRIRSSPRSLSPATQRRKAPVRKVNEHSEMSVEIKEKEPENNEVKSFLQWHEAPILPMIGTPILKLQCSTVLTLILIVAAQKTSMSCDTQRSGDHVASVKEEVSGGLVTEEVKNLGYAETLVLGGGTLDAALRKQAALMKEIAEVQAHIDTLRDGLENWNILSDRAREMLGRYHTQKDISMTLSRQEAVLSFLKSEINCADHKVEMFRRKEYLTWEPTSIAQDRQDAGLVEKVQSR